MDDVEITELVRRLSRPHASGGVVIERAAILAAGADFSAVMDWIAARHGTPDVTPPAAGGGGLHGSRVSDGHLAAARAPLRYVLPASALH
jgi:hypothetical protein